MKTLPLNALRAFATVYAEGGVRPAARRLGIAHSSVSKHLAELAAWLGVSLIQESKGRRGIAFTAHGEALGKATLAGLRNISNSVASLREAKSADSVTISTAPSFAARWLLPRLGRLQESHPRIEVSVLVDQRLDDPSAGGIDMAIRMGPGPWPGVRCEPLMDDILYPVMSPALFEDAGRPRIPTDLLDLRLLHDRDPQASWNTWREAHGPESLDVLSGPRFSSSDMVLHAARLGQGVALARHRLSADDIASGALIRPIDGLKATLGTAYWIVLPRRGRPSAATLSVVDWLKTQVERDGAPS